MLGSVRVLSDIAATNLAIEICNIPELKREILCLSNSDYDISKRNLLKGEMLPGRLKLRHVRKWTSTKDTKDNNKKLWDEIVENKAMAILKNLGLPEKLQEKVKDIVFLIGLRMVTWAKYHEGTLGFSREYTADFLKSSFFTQQGVIDNKKAAEELMNDKNLSVQQKYQVACLYCFTDHISVLYKQITINDMKKFCCTRSPGLVRFWSYYLMGEVDKIKGDKPLDQYRLETAIESGSKAAVEYCLEKTGLKRKEDAVIDAAVEAVRNRIIAREYGVRFRNSRAVEVDLFSFHVERYDGSKESWVSSDYYVDILCFLLSKMREDQQIEFLKKDIEGIEYDVRWFEDQRQSRVLKYLLNWPYQNFFMEMARLMWEFLPERNYAILLHKICDKIEPKKEMNLKYGGEKSYDYRGLLREFWCQSPERYKRYVLSNRPADCDGCTGLLIQLVTIHNFTHEDKENIKLILASATEEEKEDIVSSNQWRHLCLNLIRRKDWKPLDRFLLIFFSSQEEVDKFKKKLIITEDVFNCCIDLKREDDCEAVELFIKRIALPEEEIKQFKREMIYSDDGMFACLELIKNKGAEAADRFIRWHFSCEGEVKTFKKYLIYSIDYTCARLIESDELDLVNEFMKLCLSSEKEIREFKENFAYRKGSWVLEYVFRSYIYSDMIWSHSTSKCKGFSYEKVEKFLTFFFSSEEEISDFKKNVLLKESGKEIHLMFIKVNRLEEAENFFAWLGLSSEEIKELKRDTLFHHEEASMMFSELMYSNINFDHYGSTQEAIPLLLRWYLTDRETVLEFKDKFKRQYHGEVTDEDRAMLENFDLMIEQRLRDLDKEQMGVKRKSETSSTSKKLCNL